MKTEKTEATGVASTEGKVEKRGRKVSETSVRQIRLRRFAEKIARGEKVSRGRPKKSDNKK